ncbi:SOSS complex subunit B1-like [Chironomus tepperi]|uniref:SOSS complex subunit B1-like n=1 Tax=Chironomus tepperi TaxID=113505 RepID=UPI00391F905B
MTKCYTLIFKSELTIYKYNKGNIVKIGDFCMVYNDKVDMSQVRIKQEAIDVLKSRNSNQKFVTREHNTAENKNIQINMDENKKVESPSTHRNTDRLSSPKSPRFLKYPSTHNLMLKKRKKEYD